MNDDYDGDFFAEINRNLKVKTKMEKKNIQNEFSINHTEDVNEINDYFGKKLSTKNKVCYEISPQTKSLNDSPKIKAHLNI